MNWRRRPHASIDRWSEVKAFLRRKGVYHRHLLQKMPLQAFGNSTASKFAQSIRSNGNNEYIEILGIYMRIFE